MSGKSRRTISVQMLAILLLGLSLLISAKPAAAQEVILYDFENFGGRQLRLTQSAPDLDAFGFDNDVASIRILSGQWSFHRDDGFQNLNGPPLTLGPGTYPNIAALGFPAERMSSVRLISFDEGNGDAGDTLQPTPNCRAPYQSLGANNQCVFTCAEGTEPDVVSRECRCRSGFEESGTDSAGRRICRLDPNGPVQGVLPGQLNPISPPGQGNVEALPTFDVTPNVTLLPDAQIQRYRVNAGLAMRIARQQGFTFRTDIRGNDAVSCEIASVGGELEIIAHYNASLLFNWEAGIVHFTQNCVFRLFGGRSLATGWVMDFDAEVTVRDGCARRHGNIRLGEQSRIGGLTDPTITGNPYRERPALLIQALFNVNNTTCSEYRWRVNDIVLRGPAGADWRTAFAQ